MKLSKKFLEDLHKIGEWSFVEKNMWIGKLVPEIIVDNLQERGISQEDIEGCVMLSVEEAKVINKLVYMASCAFILTNEQLDAEEMLEKRIEQAEMSKQST